MNILPLSQTILSLGSVRDRARAGGMTGYGVYLGDTRLPVAPESISYSVGGQNRTLSLINGDEIDVLRQPRLMEISFSALLPNVDGYPFAAYENNNFRPASEYKEIVQTLKTRTDRNGRLIPFRFRIDRTLPGTEIPDSFGLDVSIQQYSFAEASEDGFDVRLDITLKEYRHYATKTVTVTNGGDDGAASATVVDERAAHNAPSDAAHTVRAGETLLYIARTKLGDGDRWEEIYRLNQAAIDAENDRVGAVKYTIHERQTLRLSHTDGGDQ